MRWVGVILGLFIVGLGVSLIFLSVLLSNRSSNTGLTVIGFFIVLVGLGLSVWMIRRARRRYQDDGWRFLDH